MKRLALLDNDALVLRVETGYLHRVLHDFAIVWVETDPQKAIRASLSGRLVPDVLVVDMSLEGMTGVDVCREIRSRTPDVGLVGVTSFSLGIYGCTALENGAQCLVDKADLETAARAIRAVGDGSYLDSERCRALGLGEYVSAESAEAAHVRLAAAEAHRAAELDGLYAGWRSGVPRDAGQRNGAGGSDGQGNRVLRDADRRESAEPSEGRADRGERQSGGFQPVIGASGTGGSGAGEPASDGGVARQDEAVPPGAAVSATWAGQGETAPQSKASQPDAWAKSVLLTGASWAGKWQTLSEREMQALALYAEGLTLEQICVRMGVSVSSVKTFLLRARRKLGVESSEEAAAMLRAMQRVGGGAGRASGEGPAGAVTKPMMKPEERLDVRSEMESEKKSAVRPAVRLTPGVRPIPGSAVEPVHNELPV